MDARESSSNTDIRRIKAWMEAQVKAMRQSYDTEIDSKDSDWIADIHVANICGLEDTYLIRSIFLPGLII